MMTDAPNRPWRRSCLRSLAALCAAAFVLAGCELEGVTHEAAEHAEGHEKSEELYHLPVTQPLRDDMVLTQDYVAQIRSSQHIELRNLEHGYLQDVFVDEGESVKKGQRLFQVMPLVYQAELEKSAAEAEFARIEYENTRQLASNQVVSSQELALAKAKYEKAKAELALARTHLGLTEIRAPFDGIVGRFQVRLGSLLEEGELLTTLSDNRNMWVYFNVAEREYLEYQRQHAADDVPVVRLELANGEVFSETGRVETIEADFNNETGNIAFRATFPNPDGVLRHGATGKVLLDTVLEQALIIPQKATFDVLDRKYVFVVDEDDIVHSRQVVIGAEQPHRYAVTAGLDESNHILVEGLRRVREGDRIEPRYVESRELFAELTEMHAE